MVEPRWLDRDAVASYVSVRVDHLPRLVREGKLPTPVYHFGPKNPRWDRLAIDQMFGVASDNEAQEAAVRDAVQAIREAPPRRPRKNP